MADTTTLGPRRGGMKRWQRRGGQDDTNARRTVSRARRPWSAALIALLLAALGAGLPASAAALTSAGQLYAFGLNEYGQLGTTINAGGGNANPTPTLVSLPGASAAVTQVAAGGSHSLALTSAGQLYAFGENYFGELANSANNGTSNENPTPTPVSLAGASGPLIQLAAGFADSFALTSTGQLYAFGENFYGQLGNATNEETLKANPTPTPVGLPVGASGQVAQIAAGSWHSLALTSTGQLYAFGKNEHGELGVATNSGTLAPNPTPALVSLPGASGPVTQIAAGAEHSLALTSTGQLYAFGSNYYGQLGSATNNGTSGANPPALVSLPGASGPVTQIAAGAAHSLALTSTGQLYAFGFNSYGQLGNATNNASTDANPTPTLVSLPGAVGPVVRIAAGKWHSLALTSSGQLYAFGYNWYGQLGNAIANGTPNAVPAPTLVELPGGGSIDTIARGPLADHTLAVVADLAVASGSLPASVVGAPYSAQVQASGGAAPYRWSASGLPSGLTIDPASGALSGAPSASGGYTPTFTVTDNDGIEASATLPLAVTQPPPVVPAIAVAPTMSRLRQSASRWRTGRRLAAISRKRRAPVGTTFSFSLDQPASIRARFSKHLTGRRVRRRCVPRTHGNARHRHCTRATTAGKLSFAAHAGSNRIVFQGKLSRTKRLKPGRYTLTIIATNPAGQSSRPGKLAFTIVR